VAPGRWHQHCGLLGTGAAGRSPQATDGQGQAKPRDGCRAESGDQGPFRSTRAQPLAHILRLSQPTALFTAHCPLLTAHSTHLTSLYLSARPLPMPHASLPARQLSRIPTPRTLDRKAARHFPPPPTPSSFPSFFRRLACACASVYVYVSCCPPQTSAVLPATRTHTHHQSTPAPLPFFLATLSFPPALPILRCLGFPVPPDLSFPTPFSPPPLPSFSTSRNEKRKRKNPNFLITYYPIPAFMPLCCPPSTKGPSSGKSPASVHAKTAQRFLLLRPGRGAGVFLRLSLRLVPSCSLDS